MNRKTRQPFFCIIFLIFLCQSLIALDAPIGIYNPKVISPFQLPKDPKLNKLLKDYRKRYSKVTGLEFSGLHWNMGIVVYINEDSETYIKNHIAHLKTLIDEDEDEDDGEWEEESDKEETTASKKVISKEMKKATSNTYVPGVVIIKENYAMKKSVPVAPTFLTIMIKREPGYDPKYNDWEYLQTSVDGQIILRGKYENPQVKNVCADCHGNIKERDYIFSTYLTKPQAKKTFERSN